MLGGRDISALSDIPTPDLKRIIPEMRQSLLKGAKVLFTGVIPTNIPPQRSPIWNTARAFGAVVHDRLVPGLGSSSSSTSSRPRTAARATTHVIAGKAGTAKLKEARRMPGVKIVNPRWLWSCAEQWKWVDERDFPVEMEESTGSKDGRKKTRSKGSESEDTQQESHSSIEQDTKSKDLFPDLATSSELLSDSRAGPSGSGRSGSGRLESRISVSDEELERMEAEVEAEMMMGSSSSGSSEEGEGGNSVEQSFEDTFNHGGQASCSDGMLESRKRKRAEIDDPSRSNSPQSTSEPEPHANSDDSSDDDDDALAALLAGDSPS